MNLTITKSLTLAALLTIVGSTTISPAYATTPATTVPAVSTTVNAQIAIAPIRISHYTIRHTLTGASITGKIDNVSKPTLVTFRASSYTFTGQTGYYKKVYTDANGYFAASITDFKTIPDKDRYWQLELSTAGSSYGKIIARGKIAVGKAVTGRVVTAAPAPAPAPVAPGAGTIVKKGFITGYTIHDNDPAGSKAIAYSKEWNNATIHTEAGGTGTYENPITLAAQVGDYAPGTRFYLPHVDRYFILEDTCASCGDKSEWIDMWIGGEMTDSATATDSCARALTGDFEFWVNPQQGLPVTTGPLFNSITDTCAVPTP